jgi:hypothetical protein
MIKRSTTKIFNANYQNKYISDATTFTLGGATTAATLGPDRSTSILVVGIAACRLTGPFDLPELAETPETLAPLSSLTRKSAI